MSAPPRLLVTIPHFFGPTGDPRYGSTYHKAEARRASLLRCIASVHQTLGSRQGMLQVGARTVHGANQRARVDVDIVVCTVGDAHLLDGLGLDSEFFTHERTDIANPMLLGFECHRILKERFGSYDWYAYLEDDLLITDPMFLTKQAWFKSNCGPKRVLQPNRFEVSTRPRLHKMYVDGDLSKAIVDIMLPQGPGPNFHVGYLDLDLLFVRALNPHSGCFFLSADQMGYWLEQPHYLDRNVNFLGPLESAATLGVLRTFHIFKPHAENAAFLEIQHQGDDFIAKVAVASA